MYVCVECDLLMILFIDDINWYEVMLMFMIMLIENDVIIEDDIDNNWYETVLMFMIILISKDVVIDDNIDMRWWCYCW